MYNLTFFEAIEKCAKGEGFIRGEKFKDGVYVKKQGEILIAVDAFNANKIIGNFFVSTGIMSQSYKVFDEVQEGELLEDCDDLAFLHYKAT